MQYAHINWFYRPIMKILTTLLTALSLSLAMPSLTSCSGDDEIPTPPQPEEVAQHTIGINAEAAGFTRADATITNLQSGGFYVQAICPADAIDGIDISFGFKDECRYTNGEWSFWNGPHLWPQEMTLAGNSEPIPTEMYFFAIYDANQGYYGNPFQYANDGELKFEYSIYYDRMSSSINGTNDLMAAKLGPIKYNEENEGEISLQFQHILTKVAFNLTLNTTSITTFDNYSAHISLTSPYLDTFDFNDFSWKNNAGSQSKYKVEGSNLTLNTQPQQLGDALYVVPNDYILQININGHKGNDTEGELIKSAQTILSLKDMMGNSTIVNIATDPHSNEIIFSNEPHTTLDTPVIR